MLKFLVMIFEIVIACGCVSAGYGVAEKVESLWLCLAIATLFIVLAQGFHLLILGINPLYIVAGSLAIFKGLSLMSEGD